MFASSNWDSRRKKTTFLNFCSKMVGVLPTPVLYFVPLYRAHLLKHYYYFGKTLDDCKVFSTSVLLGFVLPILLINCSGQHYKGVYVQEINNENDVNELSIIRTTINE